MNLLQTILYFVLPPVVIYGLIALLVAGPRMSRAPRYRVGQPWTYEPMFWTANPEGAHLPAVEAEHQVAVPRVSAERVSAERGGARGSW